MSVRRKVNVTLEVEFDDKDLPTPDVDEALVDGVKGLKKMLFVMPKVKGKSSRGREVSFAIKDLELSR